MLSFILCHALFRLPVRKLCYILVLRVHQRSEFKTPAVNSLIKDRSDNIPCAWDLIPRNRLKHELFVRSCCFNL
jgi:hypothetical protein